MRYLRQSTATTVVVGPLIDYNDGKTPLMDNETFTAGDISCELVKGATSAEITVSKTGANAFNLTGSGLASMALTATNTDTAGTLRLSFTNTITGGYSSETILPFSEDFTVLTADAYDALMASSDATLGELIAAAREARVIAPGAAQWYADAFESACDLLDVYGEVVTYIPKGGVSRSIAAVVRHSSEGEHPSGTGPLIEIHVLNDSSVGIASDELNLSGDTVSIAPRVGITAISRYVESIMEQNDVWLKLRVI
jgi:hypothetical protein